MPSEGEFIDNFITVLLCITTGLLWPLNWNGLKVVDKVSRIVYAVILIFSAVSYFLTRLCQTSRNEVGFLLKYTTLGPSQADCAICKDSDAGDQIVAGETVLELSYN